MGHPESYHLGWPRLLPDVATTWSNTESGLGSARRQVAHYLVCSAGESPEDERSGTRAILLGRQELERNLVAIDSVAARA
jgi:hypothetical protein